jgi:hypothetical protein
LKTISLSLISVVFRLSSLCFAAAGRDGRSGLLPAGWEELAQLTASDGAQTFATIAIDGNTDVVGAPYGTAESNYEGAPRMFLSNRRMAGQA